MTTTKRRPTVQRSGPDETTSDVVLSSHIRPRQSYLRAAHLERHQDQVEHYIPTGRALEVLRRLLNAVEDPSAGRAWSLTGPYGAGKSSFALFLHALFGPVGPQREHADASLRDVEPKLFDTLARVRTALGADARGFVLAATTCQAEPLNDSLLRALTLGCNHYWPKGWPKSVEAAVRQARTARSARTVARAVETIAAQAPVLIVLDEFGKTLEYFAATTDAADAGVADLFVLQEIAERASATDGAPVLLFTLQHLAFDDYVRKASAAQRREWGKVQGRFEDVPFLETAEQSLRLVAGALDDSALTPALKRGRTRWAEGAYEQVQVLGLSAHLPGGVNTLTRCYPLHPTALLALPELCARLGQHGRTLFTFLASSEPHTMTAFLNGAQVPRRSSNELPTLKLAEMYDFFSGPGQALASGVGGARWREIDERVKEAGNLDPRDLACLKTVGLLNLLAQVSGLRASADIVTYALGTADRAADEAWRKRLVDLEGRGWLTYRAFADEYRLWQGSDVDLRGRVADAREQLHSTSPAQLMGRLQASAPLIAGKHSQRVGMLRYFSIGYADGSTKEVDALPSADPADGSLIYYLDDPATIDVLRAPASGRPVVIATSEQAPKVREAAIEVAAALAVLDQQDVVDDRVARRELQDRVSDARSRLASTFAAVFRAGSSSVRWRRLTAEGPAAELSADRGVSRLLSDVCDEVYDQSPEIRNEMLGRRELTSQGAKARRMLLEAMLDASDQGLLGIQGYGPERAMYEAMLRYTGVHRQDADGVWGFQAPQLPGKLGTAWGAIAQVINPASDAPAPVSAIYERLTAAPIGLKSGPIPVILAAYLLHRSDDVAIYEDGTYQPVLTADLLERLVKTPQRFAVKSFDTAGARAKILNAVDVLTADAIGQPGRLLALRGMRNSTVLSTAAPLLTFARSLPQYTRHTSALSDRAVAVRAALLAAREPDVLLFSALPTACGTPELGRRRARIDDQLVNDFAGGLKQALLELQQAYPRRLADNGDALARELGLSADLPDLRGRLAVRAQELEGKVIDPKLRTFLFTATSTEQEDTAWLESLSLSVADKPPAAWRDIDVARFDTNLRSLVGAFRRVEALHYHARAAAGDDGFTAQRLTLTAPDGREVSRVMYVDDRSRSRLEHVAQKALDQAAAAAGPQGQEALLAMLTQLVLMTDGDTRNTLSVGREPSSMQSSGTNTKEIARG